MRVLIVLLVLSFVASLTVLLAAVCRALPDTEGAPPAPPAAPRLARPPSSPLARLRARSTVCRHHGHTYRLAFPMGRLAQQCTACGAIAPRLVVRSHRVRA